MNFDDSLFRAIREMERTLAPMRELEKALAVQRELRKIAIPDSVLELQRQLNQSATYNFSFSNSVDRKILLDMAHAAEQARLLSASHIASYGSTAYLAKTSLELANIDALRLRLDLPVRLAEGLTVRVRKQAQAVGRLLEDVPNSPVPNPESFADTATTNLFTQGEAIGVLSDPEAPRDPERLERTESLIITLDSELDALLSAVGQPFVAKWRGARDAMVSSNPDKSRHVLISLRTLWDDLLNRFAPEKEVSRAAAESDFTVTRDGRKILKREARFRYITSRLQYQRLANAVEADAAALVKTYGILNDVHNGTLELSDGELKLVVLRIEGAVKFLVQTAVLFNR
jgi:hypothetical protein